MRGPHEKQSFCALWGSTTTPAVMLFHSIPVRWKDILFVALSITGLLLTEWLMWAGVEQLRCHYMLTKVVVTGIVMVYNFVTKKFFLEDRSKMQTSGDS